MRLAFWALSAVILSYCVTIRPVWLWIVHAGDYFLGNPGPFGEYRDKLFEQEYLDFPVKGYVKPSAILEVHADNYSFETFKLLTEDWTKPLIVRDLFKTAPVMKWTPEYLVEHYKTINRTFLYVENNRMGNEDGFFVYDANTAPLDQIVANISGGGSNYIHNSAFYYPEDLNLYKEIELERTKLDRKAFLVQFFLGRSLPGEKRLGGSPLHCAGAPNLFVQVSGSKKWITIDAKYSRYIRPRHFSNQLAAYSVAGINNEGNDTNVRWSQFPRSEGIIHPGDMIWVPGWLWHEVHNIPSEKWNIGLATRYSVLPSLWKNNWLFTVLTDLGTGKKKCPPGFRFLCATLITYEGGTTFQRYSEVAKEVDNMVQNMKVKKVEQDFE